VLEGDHRDAVGRVTGRRAGVYVEKDSPFLEGMGDRSTTLMGGLALRYDLPLGIELSAGYEQDVLAQIGGGAASVKIEETFHRPTLELITGCATNVRFAQDQYIFHEGEAADHFYIIRAGRVALEIFTPGGAVNVGTYGPRHAEQAQSK